jgi:mono/diheme cytochrome c family protein
MTLRRTRWRRITGAAIAIGMAGSLAAAAFFFWPHGLEPIAASKLPRDTLVARGQYLAVAADCEACHTAQSGKPFAGGRGFKLPFGTLYSPNITSDPTNGIGSWSDAEFVRAMRHGIGKHGEDLYPAFPYTSYALMTTDDMLALRAFLSTVPPVQTPPVSNTLAFPFDQRWVMRGWKLLFVPSNPLAADPARSARWNRGAYLVEALAHCGECHTPRNLAFATKGDQRFAGAPVDGWIAYNITSDPASGIGAWTDDALTAYLSGGHAEGHGTASGGMGEAVNYSLQHLTHEDVDSMVTYLRTIPARPSATPISVAENSPDLRRSAAWSPEPGEAPSEGGQIFAGACASCHAWNGSGQLVPPTALRGARTVNDPTGANLIRVILHGGALDTGSGQITMPAFARAYSDSEIADLSNYVVQHFGNKVGRVTPTEVAAARHN